MVFNEWWRENPRGKFWLEITDRADLGVDLNALQRKDDGKEFWGYSLIKLVRDGEGSPTPTFEAEF